MKIKGMAIKVCSLASSKHSINDHFVESLSPLSRVFCLFFFFFLVFFPVFSLALFDCLVFGFVFVFVFEAGSQVTEADLKLLIFLFLPLGS